jgi:hypothetical protein
MKTPKKAAREYAETLWNRESTPEWEVSRDACKTRSGRDFLAGDAFGYRRGLEKAYRWISVEEELPDDDTLILTKDTDGHIDLIRGWQLKERIKPYAVQNFYTHWRPIEPVNK